MVKRLSTRKTLKTKKIDQQEYLDTLFALENRLANNQINDKQFEENCDILRSLINERG